MLKNISNAKKQILSRSKNAQTAVEYMLLLAMVVSIVLIFMKLYLPEVEGGGNLYYDKVIEGLYGKPYPCGDGRCQVGSESIQLCCVDCGGCNCTPGNVGCPFSTGKVTGRGCSGCPNGENIVNDTNGVPIEKHCTQPLDDGVVTYATVASLCEDLLSLDGKDRHWFFEWTGVNW